MPFGANNMGGRVNLGKLHPIYGVRSFALFWGDSCLILGAVWCGIVSYLQQKRQSKIAVLDCLFGGDKVLFVVFF